MLFVLISWVVITAVFLTFGDIAISLWNKATRKKEEYGFLNTFWIGLCSVGMLLLFISLFCPINSYLLALFVGVSLVFIFFRRTFYIHLFKSLWTSFSSLTILTKCTIASAFLATLIYALSTPILFDFGLYHLQSMMWTEGYSIVPGLGNLHGRFGFNSSFLLLSTLFGYHPDVYSPLFAINSLCVFFFSTWVIYRISKMESVIQQLVLAVILLFYALNFIKYVSSTSTDILVHIFVIYLLINLTLSNRKITDSTLLYVFIPIFCATLKLSSAVIVLLPIFIFLSLLKQKKYRETIVLVALSLLVIVPWCIRFVVTTGYLIYPYPSLDLFSFDWKMPIQHVIDEKESATAWARIAHRPTAEVMSMSITEWVPIWLRALSRIDLLLYIIAALSFIVVFIRRKTICANYALLAWGISICGLIFGLLTAPDPRFGFGFIICCGFIPLFGIGVQNKVQKRVLFKTGNVTLLMLCLIFIGFSVLGIRQIIYNQDKTVPYYALMIHPQSIDNTKVLMNASFTENKMENGSVILSPGVDNRCFDVCLLCMPYFDNRIEFRGPKLEAGFRMKKD